jgi:hypothetical protein
MMNNTQRTEKQYPSIVGKGLIIGFAVILAVCLIPAIINLSINQTIFKTDFYAGVLKKTDFYDQVPVLLGDTVLSSGNTALQNGLLAGLDQEQVNWLMTSLLPPGWVETETNAAMTSVLDFMNFKSDALRIVVDLQPIKDYLASPEGKQSLVNLLESLPDCSEDQLTQIMISMQSGQGGFALCHPPSSDLFNMETMLDPVIRSFSDSLPTVILLPSSDQAGIIDTTINSPIFQVYRNVRTILSLFQWLCLLLAAFILLLSLRSLRWMATALGFPLVFASFATAIPGVWLFLSGGRDFSGLFVNAGLGSIQGLEGMLIQVFQNGLQTAGQGLLIWCLGSLTIGLVLLVIGFLAKKKPHELFLGFGKFSLPFI